MIRLAPFVFLAACSPPPEQPDLNTYGMIQPICVVWCKQTQTLTEADGGNAPISITTSEDNRAGAAANANQ